MAAPREREEDDFATWAGHGLRATGPGETLVILAPGLIRYLRRQASILRTSSQEERVELQAFVDRLVRAIPPGTMRRMGGEEREVIDEVLRRLREPPP